MGIGVIGVLAGAAASPFKTGAEVTTVKTNGFYRKITQTVAAGEYIVHFRGANDHDGIVGYMSDDNGTRYPLHNGENFITLESSTTSLIFSKAFWNPPYFQSSFQTEYNSNDNRANTFTGPAVNKYGNYITRREYSLVGGSSNHRYAILSSQDGAHWTRSSNTTGYNWGPMYGGPYLNGRGGVWLRPDGTSRTYGSPDFAQEPLTSGTGITTAFGSSRTMWDYADYSSGVDAFSAYFVLTNNNTLYTSSTGKGEDFTYRTSPPDNPRVLGYANGKAFLLMASNGTFWEFTAADGSRNVRSIGVTEECLRIDHDGTTYCISTNFGNVYYSTDLNTWTQATFPAGNRGGRSFVKWVPEDNEWVLATEFTAYKSADGITWEVSEDPSWKADSWYQMTNTGQVGLDQYMQFTDPRAPYTFMSKTVTTHTALGNWSTYRWPGFTATMLEAI